jgi:hypothetical protein
LEIMNRSYLLASLVVLIASVTSVGCDSGGDGGGQSMDALAAQIDQNKKADDHAAAVQQAKQEAAKRAEEKQAADEAARQQAAAIEAAKAEEAANAAAAGQQQGGTTTAGGATVGQEGGYLSAIAGAHRHITTRMDDVAWTQQLQHYKAETGNMPKTSEEFLQIMQERGIPLPELEEGQQLYWDPNEGEWGALYIVEPAPQQPPAPPAG